MRQYLKEMLFAELLLLMPALSFAAEASATAPAAASDAASSFNPVFIGLATVIILLLFVIAVLGNVLRQLAVVYRDKLRNERNKTSITKAILLLAMLSIPALNATAQEVAGAAGETASVASSPFISGVPRADFLALMFVIMLEILILLALLLSMRILLKAISARPELLSEAKEIVKKVPFWDKINAVTPIEKEQDIMLDHDYDGIRELDNSLPPWWKYGFYLTIVVAVVYIWYYHGGGNGPSSEQEYITAVQKGEEEKAAYLAKTAGNIDESNVKMADAAGIEEGKTLYVKNCAACHAADGGGLVGPNLTDDYWIHGGSMQSIFKSIKYGWQDKGMKSWKDDFSPKQLQSLASYVKSLRGSKPAAPKEQQGDLYVEENNAPAADSASDGGNNNQMAVR